MFIEFDQWDSDEKVTINVFFIAKVEREAEEDDEPSTALRVVGERDCVYIKGTYDETVAKINGAATSVLVAIGGG